MVATPPHDMRVATPTHEGSAIVFLLSPEDFSYITWRTVWMCVQCGCVYSVDVCTVWMCVQCGCVYSVDVCTVWMCVQCGCVYSVDVSTVWMCVLCT